MVPGMGMGMAPGVAYTGLAGLAGNYDVQKDWIDAKDITDPDNPKQQKWEVFINGGRTPTDLDALDWAKKVAGLGAGEILLTSMDYDGTKDGYDIALTKAIVDAVNIPVIASGGAGKLEHFYDCFSSTQASACLAASIFHYQEYTVRQAKEYLKERGVPVRL
jgi:cyclase